MENLRWKLLTDDEVLMPMLWSRAGRLKKQKGCSADVTRLGSNYKTSLGWIHDPQCHVILAMIFFFFLFLNFFINFLKTKLAFYNTVLLPNGNIQ